MPLHTISVPLGKNRAIRLPEVIWFLLAIGAVSAELLHHNINNYSIFKGVFWHTVHETNLYAAYPSEYFDVNHYGPFFSALIAPFAILPDWLGVFLWCLVNALVLFYAIKKLPLGRNTILAILSITVIEMMTAVHNVQINPMLAGWLILAFVMTEKGKNFWATLFIAAGFMVKIYGIAGLIFFAFSKNRLQFVLSFIFWIAVMFFLPMLFSSPSFVAHSYYDWVTVLVQKNAHNTDALSHHGMQDISLMGFITRVFGIDHSINQFVLIPAFIMILLPLLRFDQYKFLLYRISYLAIVLISVVVFSTSAESATYIIAVMGAAIWFAAYPYNKWSAALLVFMFLLTCLASTDLAPAYVQDHFIRRYSLKAVPCIIIWAVLMWNTGTKNFRAIRNPV
jgi:Glycosyltransferase family 87